MSPENRPIVDELRPGLFVMGLFSGFGIMAAPAAAQLVALMLQRKPLPSYAKAFSASRYQDQVYMANMHKIVSGKL